MNGDQQNFNPVYRLMNGQIYGVDFIDYLGTGHLISGYVGTMLLGGNFFASKIAFLSFPCFSEVQHLIQ